MCCVVTPMLYGVDVKCSVSEEGGVGGMRERGCVHGSGSGRQDCLDEMTPSFGHPSFRLSTTHSPSGCPSLRVARARANTNQDRDYDRRDRGYDRDYDRRDRDYDRRY